VKHLIRRSILALFALAVGTLAGCGDSSTAPPATAVTGAAKAGGRTYPYKVVTTVGMVTDIVQHVAGDKAKVHGIIGEGVDPHLYKTTRNDVAAMLEADAVFYSGLMLEGKMSDTLVKVSGQKPVFAVTQLLDEKYLLEPAEFQGHFDPHVWMDASAWMKAVEAVAKSLGEFDAPNAALYQSNAAAYLEELKKLDAYAKQAIGSIPQERRVLITAHDAFNYFGRAYNLDVRGIQGISTESEAGLQDLNKLVDLIVSKDISAVFVETSVSEKNVKALVEVAASRGKKVAIGGKLFSDAMGAPGTYVGMIDHNVTVIARALGGEAPERGFQGKLKVEAP